MHLVQAGGRGAFLFRKRSLPFQRHFEYFFFCYGSFLIKQKKKKRPNHVLNQANGLATHVTHHYTIELHSYIIELTVLRRAKNRKALTRQAKEALQRVTERIPQVLQQPLLHLGRNGRGSFPGIVPAGDPL